MSPPAAGPPSSASAAASVTKAQTPPAPTGAQAKAYAEAIRRGQRRTRSGDHPEAVEAFTAALTIVPHDARALAGRGYAHLRAGVLDDAERDLLASLAARPDHTLQAMTEYNLGLLEDARGNTAAALAHYRRSATLRPTKAARRKAARASAAEAASAKCPRLEAGVVAAERFDGWLALHGRMAAALQARDSDPVSLRTTPTTDEEARLELCDDWGQPRCDGDAPWVVTLASEDEDGPYATAVVSADAAGVRAVDVTAHAFGCMATAVELRVSIHSDTWTRVRIDRGCDGYGVLCDDEDDGSDEDELDVCEKTFFHDAERTILILDPATLEQQVALRTVGRLDDWRGESSVPFEDTLDLDGDVAVVAGSCKTRYPL